MKVWGASFIQRMLDGDPSCFEEIFDECAENILRLAYLILRDSDEAKDILQESMLRLIRETNPDIPLLPETVRLVQSHQE
jgi:DNA-directed RNA polymerase specialized sigma24 family protein